MAKNNHDNEEDKVEDELSDLSFDEESESEELSAFDEFDEELFKEMEAEDLAEAEEAKEQPSEEEPVTEEVEETVTEEQVEEEEPEVVQMEMEEKGPVSPRRIPVSIAVEVGNIQMTMDKLLQLEPGNLLDIPANPENGVDLTINGKLVARGELIRIGENLGVRIIELG